MKESVQLNQENLRLLSEEIVRPKYDRSRIKAGIVHIGVGGFHRSHEAYYTDELMGAGDLAEWGDLRCGLEGGGPEDVWRRGGSATDFLGPTLFLD
jgi:mannitol 2-dehydrogenase